MTAGDLHPPHLPRDRENKKPAGQLQYLRMLILEEKYRYCGRRSPKTASKGGKSPEQELLPPPPIMQISAGGSVYTIVVRHFRANILLCELRYRQFFLPFLNFSITKPKEKFMCENLTPQESMAPEIGHLINEVQSLQNQTYQLQQTTNALKDGQDELAHTQQTQGRILSQIQSLTTEHQRALEQQNKSLAEIKENQLKMLKEVELLKADNSIIKKRLEIQELELREQQLREQRLQQLVSTFQSLHYAVMYVSKQGGYFEKYVWLVYFKNKIGTKGLNPNELASLSDRLAASNTIETFEQEFSKSEKALTKKDKKDIDTSAVLINQIPNEEVKLNEMKRIITKENYSLLSLENKLKRLKAMEGYSQSKLLAFKTWGLILIVVGLLLSIYGFVSEQDAINANKVIPIIGIGLFIIGVLFLWLRYINDKQNRLAEETQKWGNLNSQHSQRNDDLKSLQAKISNDKKELEDIWKRRPVLKAVEISYN